VVSRSARACGAGYSVRRGVFRAMPLKKIAVRCGAGCAGHGVR